MEKETNPQNLTLAEIEELKKKQITFMEKQLKALEVQEKYFKLKRLIAEHVFEEALAKVKFAQLRNPEKLASHETGSDYDIDKKST